jgi:hypothetical protein
MQQARIHEESPMKSQTKMAIKMFGGAAAVAVAVGLGGVGVNAAGSNPDRFRKFYRLWLRRSHRHPRQFLRAPHLHARAMPITLTGVGWLSARIETRTFAPPQCPGI